MIWLRGSRKFKDGGPSFCWHCNKQLMLMLMRGGAFSFRLVVDRAGVEHRVHKRCVRWATEDGDAKEKKHEAT